MTVTRLPPPLTTTTRPTSPSSPPRHPPRANTSPPISTSPRSSRSTAPHPTRSLTSPPTPQGAATMTPAMNSGPASHLGHSTSPLQSSAMTVGQYKSHSAHGHGTQQASYFAQAGSGVSSEATTPRPSMPASRSAGRVQHVDDLEIPLVSPNPPFAGSSASRPSSPRSTASHSDDTHARSRNDGAPSSSPQTYGQTSGQSFVSSSYTAAASLNSNSNGWAPSSNNTSTTTLPAAPCSACQQPMSGQFVRALGTVFHLDCFRCGVSGTWVLDL